MKYCFMFILLSISAFFACTEVKKPRLPCEMVEIPIPLDTSYLSTPVVIPLRLIEKKLNRMIKKDIPNHFADENEDKLKLKITRLGDILIIWKDNVATYEVPLLILVERNMISKKLLPRSKALALKLEFSLKLIFETTIEVDEDWKLQPSTQFVSFHWLSEVKTLGGLIDLRNMVERRLHRKMPLILENMDTDIRAKIHLDRVMTKVWRDIQKPIRINKKEELVWLKVYPIRFEMGQITTHKDSLIVQTRLSATTETMIGTIPVYAIKKTLPRLVKRQFLPNAAYIYMLSKIPFSDLNEIVNRRLAGSSFEFSEHKIDIESADLQSCGANLVLHLNIKGDILADVYLQGKPRYDQVTQRLVIENFDFEVETQDMLTGGADWVLHSTFREQLEASLSLELSTQIKKIPADILIGIEAGRLGKKIELHIEHWDFKPQEIWVRTNDLATLIIVNASVKIVLEKI
jgi:Domain of unknown function (DUF4403)